MAAPYSTDLRKRAVSAALKEEITRAEVARQFDISEATLYTWLRRWKADATLEPLPHAGGPQPSLDEEAMKQLADMVEQENDRTIDEYRTAVEERLGVAVSRSALHRALQKLKLPRKKDATGR
jgi:transposase